MVRRSTGVTAAFPAHASESAANASFLFASTPMSVRPAPSAVISSSAPRTTSAARSVIRRQSQVMYGSHSAPFRTSVSTAFFGASLTCVGNPAPPIPIMPHSLTLAIISSADGSARGGRETLSYAKSLIISICLHFPPVAVGSSLIPATVPDTEECTRAET